MLLRHARYLVAIADHGSFTRAAAEMHVSQPALSQQIRQLEEMLGARLLDRTGRIVRPTDAGRAYMGSPHGLYKIVRQRSLLVSNALHCKIEGWFGLQEFRNFVGRDRSGERIFRFLNH